MKRNFNMILILIGSIVISTSCSTSRIIGRTVPASTLHSQVNFTMDDLEYVGEVKGTSTQTYVLGIPVGGSRQHYGKVGSGGPGFPPLQSRGLDNALYEALKSQPDADFVLPLAYEYEVNKMFLGRIVVTKLRAKAFKIKVKKVEEVTKEKTEIKIEEKIEEKIEAPKE
jgi:hypothetical protein